MAQQVITFRGTSISGLVHKDKGLDITKYGQGEVQRYSEVIYTTDPSVAGKLNQKVCKEKGYGSYNVILIKWGKYKGELLTNDMYFDVVVDLSRHVGASNLLQLEKVAQGAPKMLSGYHIDDVDSVMIFNDYKGAQQYEIAFSQMLALMGVNEA